MAAGSRQRRVEQLDEVVAGEQTGQPVVAGLADQRRLRGFPRRQILGDAEHRAGPTCRVAQRHRGDRQFDPLAVAVAAGALDVGEPFAAKRLVEQPVEIGVELPGGEWQALTERFRRASQAGGSH